MRYLPTLLYVTAVVIGGVGCRSQNTDLPPVSSVPGATSSEAATPTITNTDAQKKIAVVTDDKTIPEAAKPGIIARIKHDAGLQ